MIRRQVGEIATVHAPTRGEQPLHWVGTIVAEDLGFVTVQTPDGQQHMFDAADGSLLSSTDRDARWVLK